MKVSGVAVRRNPIWHSSWYLVCWVPFCRVTEQRGIYFLWWGWGAWYFFMNMAQIIIFGLGYLEPATSIVLMKVIWYKDSIYGWYLLKFYKIIITFVFEVSPPKHQSVCGYVIFFLLELSRFFFVFHGLLALINFWFLIPVSPTW